MSRAELHAELVDLVRAAHDEELDIAGWLAGALAEVARSLRGTTEALLVRRPGSWQSDLVRQLINGTIGGPGGRRHV